MTIYHHFNISRIKDVVIVQLVDYRLFDTLVVNELQDELQTFLEEQHPLYLLVNFENVSQCSTSVINALLAAKKRLRTRGGDVRLCQMKPIVREGYQLLNLDGTVFHIHESERDGIVAFGAVAAEGGNQE